MGQQAAGAPGATARSGAMPAQGGQMAMPGADRGGAPMGPGRMPPGMGGPQLGGIPPQILQALEAHAMGGRMGQPGMGGAPGGMPGMGSPPMMQQPGNPSMPPGMGSMPVQGGQAPGGMPSWMGAPQLRSMMGPAVNVPGMYAAMPQMQQAIGGMRGPGGLLDLMGGQQ